MVLSGVGDVVSNLTAVDDWRLAARRARRAGRRAGGDVRPHGAEAVLHRPDGLESDGFLTALAEALVLSGMAMAAAGSSRPSSGADHEIMHAIDALFPGTANHGELAGVGALFSAFLREDARLAEQIDGCLRRHGCPAAAGRRSG